MELPEKDRQALIEAARRRGQGGAAFGVYPSSGKRPEKLNVSRDVNMPAQVARGWAAGLLGLPGDIESLGRLGLGLAGADVSETPVLPTSDFYREYLPGYDPAPAARAASGLGALAGGAGATRVAGAAVKGAKATGKALGPKAAEMAEGYLQRSGLAPSVIKPKGGNWLTGDVEKQTGRLKRQGVAVMPLNEEEVADYARRGYTEYDQASQTYSKPDAVNNWIDTKLNKYIRNEMGTPEDPVRKLAERDVLHFEPQQVFGDAPSTLMRKRASAGMPTPLFGKSEMARKWESLADRAVDPFPAASYKYGALDENFQASNPWLEKVPDEAMVYKAKGLERNMGFDHLIDELRNATRADSDLPANLRWKPEDLKKVTMEQAVERVAKINEYRAAKKAEADELLARNPATFQFKDYEVVPGTQEPNSKGLSWKQIQPPNLEMPEGIRRVQQSATQGGIDVPGVGFIAAKWDAKTGLDWAGAERDAKKLLGKKPLQEALDYEADVMGHCVRGYCNDVLSGNKQIYSLRDKKGEPHVTIEVAPVAIRTWDDVTSAIGKAEAAKLYDEFNAIGGYSQSNAGDVFDAFIKQKNITPPQRIVQIKGKGNAAPKAEYLPFVQDFVRSGKWSSVGDIQNTGMRPTSSVFNDAELQKLRDAGETNIPHILSGEDIQRLHNLITPEGRRLKYDAKGNIVGSEEAGYAKGGLVEDTDAIAAKLTGMDKDKALTHALRMANAKQEAHMQAGGLATLFKGAKAAKAAEEAAAAAKVAKAAKPVEKTAKPAEKAAEAAKPAVKGPQAEALETARKNAVKMLGLPENNTAMDRAKALGFDADTYHGTFNRFENFDLSKANPRSQYMPGVFTADDPRLAENFGDYIMPLRQRQGTTVLERRAARLEGSPLPEVDTIHDKSKGIRVTNNPTNIRSRFAAFDPARVNENDLLGAADPALLAGTAVASGIGLGALGQAKKRKPEQPEQKKAAGGLAALVKGSKAAKAAPAAKPAQIGNYQALPLQLPRAPNLPPQELTKTAERVARQQMGEHVRKVPNKSENLAGRSMKEVERLKNLDIELQPTKDIPTPTVVPEKKGEVRIGLPGDISIADQILMSVDNLPIGAQQEGGALYGFGKMDLPDPAFWASNRVPAQQVQNKATDVANVFDTPDVLAMHLAMGHEAMNFAQHFADANLRAIQQMPVHPESAKLFNEIVRAGNPKTGEKFPHFPGVENYEETYKALQQDPEMRKWFNNRMKVDKITGPLGLPSGKEIEYAVMEPALSNMEPSMVGLSVGRLRPGAELIPGSAHKTYSHDIPGLALGRTQELLPVDLAFPDAAAHIRKTKRPDDFTATIQKLYPHQVVDQQYIDQVGEYYNRLRQIRGYKKGGTVKKSGLSVLNKAII